mgnify:CR=1 FL=1
MDIQQYLDKARDHALPLIVTFGTRIVGAIALVYLLLVLVDWRRDLHEQYQQRTLQLYKMSALAGQEQWAVRAEAARNLQKSLQAEIPRANTIGLAQAEVQTMIRQVLNAFGPKLSSDSRPPLQVRAQPGLWRIPVTIRGQVGQAQLLEILRQAAGRSDGDWRELGALLCPPVGAAAAAAGTEPATRSTAQVRLGGVLV